MSRRARQRRRPVTFSAAFVHYTCQMMCRTRLGNWERPRLVAVPLVWLFRSRAWDLLEPFCFSARGM